MIKGKIEKQEYQDKKDCFLPKVKENRVAQDLNELEKIVGRDGEQVNWAQRILGIPDVWMLTQGQGIRVAVLDTGIDQSHQDLQSAIVATADFTGQGINDIDGHGTHCAGIVAARKNGLGFVGVAPQAELLIGKVLSKGSGTNRWVAEGIYWAMANDADIISLSLGSTISDHYLYQAIQHALHDGKFVICAAGNSGSLYENSIDYPGRLGGVITVASHNISGNPSGFSSRGGELDFMAPGTDIWSTYKNNGYASLSGTSMATPFVAGLAALIASKHKYSKQNGTPLDNNEDLKNHLMRMATHPGAHDQHSGYGALQPFEYFYHQKSGALLSMADAIGRNDCDDTIAPADR